MFKNKIFLLSFVIASTCCARQQERTPLQPNSVAMRAPSQRDSRDQRMQDYRIEKNILLTELDSIKNNTALSPETKNRALTSIINKALSARMRIAPVSVAAARTLSTLANRARSLQTPLVQEDSLQANSLN